MVANSLQPGKSYAASNPNAVYGSPRRTKQEETAAFATQPRSLALSKKPSGDKFLVQGKAKGDYSASNSLVGRGAFDKNSSAGPFAASPSSSFYLGEFGGGQSTTNDQRVNISTDFVYLTGLRL